MAMTPNFGLPYLSTAQAQKELTHNEALVLIDAVLMGLVEEAGADVPPSSPSIGQCWIVGQNPEDAWEDQAQKLTIWTEGGWRFIVPKKNMYRRRSDDGTILLFDGIEWHLPPEILQADGGSVVDVEARSVMVQLLQLLEGHGVLKMA